MTPMTLVPSRREKASKFRELRHQVVSRKDARPEVNNLRETISLATAVDDAFARKALDRLGNVPGCCNRSRVVLNRWHDRRLEESIVEDGSKRNLDDSVLE